MVPAKPLRGIQAVTIMADYAARVRGCGDPPSLLPFGCKHDKVRAVAVQKAIHFPFLAIKNGPY